MQETAKVSLSEIISAMFLVAGCCIGGGMLAMPLATGINGFLPALVIMVFCWAAMTASALLLLEVSLWMEEGSHVITMTSRILGKYGKAIAWLLFLFISYASLVAYTAGGGVQIAEAISAVISQHVGNDWGALVFLVISALVIYVSPVFVSRVNSVLFIALIAAYVALVGMGLDEVDHNYLKPFKWAGAWGAVPLLLTAFSFQTMVPSITPLLKSNPRALKLAIVGGTTIALIVYVIWEGLVLGIVPIEGPGGLREAFEKGIPATTFLKQHVGGYHVALIAEFFAFFAIITSFFGIGLGLFDFLSDGLKIKKEGSGKIILTLLYVIPVLIFATQFERVFYLALDYTGGFGDTILNGIIPVLLVWVGRYHLGYKGVMRVPGGKPILIVVFCLFAIALALEIGTVSGLIKTAPEQYDVILIHDQERLEG